jgi:hypothetical protein
MYLSLNRRQTGNNTKTKIGGLGLEWLSCGQYFMTSSPGILEKSFAFRAIMVFPLSDKVALLAVAPQVV